jgi:hypothetical protein
LPVVDEIAGDYEGEVVFLAVAGNSSLDKTIPRAEELISDRVQWGYDQSVWELYGIRGQPWTVLITGNDRVVEVWPGARDEADIRAAIDRLVSLGA